MKDVLKWGGLAGVINGLMLVSIALFPQGMIIAGALALFLFFFCIFKCTTRKIIPSALFCVLIEFAIVILYSMYDRSLIDPQYPRMPILGIYILFLLPITFVFQAILSVTAYLLSKNKTTP